MTSTFDGEKLFVFRWECLALSSQIATLNISVHDHPVGNISVIVDIITNTRALFSLNGTLLGKACLWLPPNLKVGDRVVVGGKPASERMAEVTFSGGISFLTCQGYQEIYRADLPKFLFHGTFDLDTGLLISSPNLDYIRPASVLGLGEENWIKFLRATNVDLGPRYLRTEVLTFLWNTLPIWLPATIFIIALVVMIRKRRKRRHS
jgi:hypothetical protein